MELNEIEHKIAAGELTAAQVFTQMKQHIAAYRELAKERGDFIINGEDLGYISTPTSQTDKAYAVFMRCKLTDDFAASQKQLEPEFVKLVDDHFDELLA